MNNDCTVCDGKSSCTRGNENIVDGTVICDSCITRYDFLVMENPQYKYVNGIKTIHPVILQKLKELANVLYS